MKKIISILFHISIGFLPIGLIYRTYHENGGNVIFTLGLLVILVYFITKTIKDILNKRIDRLNLVMQFFLVLMSVILYSKYLFHLFGDYPGLLIVPLFILITTIYLIIRKIKYNKTVITGIAYLILSIPLFGLSFPKSPRQYIPKEWYNRYDIEKGIPVTLPYSFQYNKTEELSINAFDFKKNKDFYSAIIFYQEALKLEPKNPKLLFDISECYARINDLKTAISVLDTAILIDSTFEGFYNNRGLLFYKLKENDKAIIDFEKAIHINPKQSIFYANLALAFYSNGLFEKACESIEKAENLGLKIDEMKELNRIRKDKCK